MKIGRRGFFKIAAIGAGVAGAAKATASSETALVEAPDSPSVLVDTTRCVGCRACEAACAEANQNPPPAEGDDVMSQRRETTPTQFTVVNKVEGIEGRF